MRDGDRAGNPANPTDLCSLNLPRDFETVIANPSERSAVMNQEKYIGMDVHQATISVAIMNNSGQLIM
ncbi:MAG: hypothetical protein WB384_07850, partial [Candidatus Sulfotelmatobacter sp.]